MLVREMFRNLLLHQFRTFIRVSFIDRLLPHGLIKVRFPFSSSDVHRSSASQIGFRIKAKTSGLKVRTAYQVSVVIMSSLVPRDPYSSEEISKLYPKDLRLELVHVVRSMS